MIFLSRDNPKLTVVFFFFERDRTSLVFRQAIPSVIDRLIRILLRTKKKQRVRHVIIPITPFG